MNFFSTPPRIPLIVIVGAFTPVAQIFFVEITLFFFIYSYCAKFFPSYKLVLRSYRGIEKYYCSKEGITLRNFNFAPINTEEFQMFYATKN